MSVRNHMRLAAILIVLSTTANAAPAPLKTVFARLAARQPQTELCFASTPDRALIACLGTTDGTDEFLYWFHVIGNGPQYGGAWMYFLQNDAAHPGTIRQDQLDDAAAYLAKHGLRPATFDFVPLERGDGSTAKVGSWTIRRIAGTKEHPDEHLEVVCRGGARPINTSDVLDLVLDVPEGPIDIQLAPLTRDQLLIVTTEHGPRVSSREAIRFDAAAICGAK